MESLSLAIPPTPGQSIVKRPDNEGLFSLGSVFESKGYRTKFIYGGYSYFDNMGYFFANNGYQAIDRDAINPKDIHYENIWGVADEDLFTLSLKELDKNYQDKKNKNSTGFFILFNLSRRVLISYLLFKNKSFPYLTTSSLVTYL